MRRRLPSPAAAGRSFLGPGLALGLLATLLVGCAPGLSVEDLTPPDPTAEDRERHARHQIRMALSFRSQDRLESAQRAR